MTKISLGLPQHHAK